MQKNISHYRTGTDYKQLKMLQNLVIGGILVLLVRIYIQNNIQKPQSSASELIILCKILSFLNLHCTKVLLMLMLIRQKKLLYR